MLVIGQLSVHRLRDHAKGQARTLWTANLHWDGNHPPLDNIFELIEW